MHARCQQVWLSQAPAAILRLGPMRLSLYIRQPPCQHRQPPRCANTQFMAARTAIVHRGLLPPCLRAVSYVLLLQPSILSHHTAPALMRRWSHLTACVIPSLPWSSQLASLSGAGWAAVLSASHSVIDGLQYMQERGQDNQYSLVEVGWCTCTPH